MEHSSYCLLLVWLAVIACQADHHTLIEWLDRLCSRNYTKIVESLVSNERLLLCMNSRISFFFFACSN